MVSSDAYPAEHAFVGHDANCEIVHGASVILSTHNFRGHIARRSRRVLCVFLSPNSSNSKVSYTQIAYIKGNRIDRINFSFREVCRKVEQGASFKLNLACLYKLSLEKSKPTISFNNQVFWLDISMNDILLMAVLKASDKACNKEPYSKITLINILLHLK